MRHRFRVGLTISLVAITLVAFIHYLSTHRYLITKLSHTPLSTVIWLLLLYTLWFGTLSLILIATLRICKKSLGVKEGFLLNAYSTFVNFLIPGQGGIAVRGIYLKKVRKLLIRNYIFVTLLYYMLYAIVSTALSLLYNRPFWETALAVLAVAGFSLGIVYLYKQRGKVKIGSLEISLASLGFLFIATVLQAVVQIAIFSVELRSISPHIAIHQAVAYTGIANFALFVALTPGAIGIRESFLVLSKKLYGISSANIIAANVIDRGVFIVFLGILFVLTIGFHARNKALFKKDEADQAASIQSSPGESSAN